MPSSKDGKTVAVSTAPADKKPYAPPKLTSIKLRPEEAVMGGCKTAPAAPGLGSGICSTCFNSFIAT